MLLVHALNRVACGLGKYANIYDTSLEVLSVASVKRWSCGSVYRPQVSKDDLKTYISAGWEVSDELAR